MSTTTETYLKQAPPPLAAVTKEIRDTVSEILLAVEREGVDAVRRYSERFDGWNPPRLRVDDADIAAAADGLDPLLRERIEFAHDQVRGFALRQRATMTDLEVETHPGVVLGHRHLPIDAVGSYSPGGRYPMLASSIMTVAVPKAAGVRRIVAAAPPRQGAGIHPPQLYAMSLSGADEIFCIGGVQAMAAMAYGIDDLPATDFIVGAGNAYVSEAKRQLFGVVGIDLLAGPTEILVIADDTASPELVAVDLLGQAEHGSTSPCVLVCRSESFGRQVMADIDRLLATTWPTAEVAGQAWRDRGEVIVVGSREEAVVVSDRYASEHLEVQAEDLAWYHDRLSNYGSLFLGPQATVAHGDKSIGVNHVLPTERAARYTGGLWVGKFLRTLTYQRLTDEGTRLIAPVTEAVATAEHMLGHAYTARYRLDRLSEGDAS